MNQRPADHENGSENASDSSEMKIKGDCYSAGERDWMEYGQQLRARWLNPALSLLSRAGVTPDHLTIVSLIFGVTFLPLWYWQFSKAAISVLWLHVALDGLDGPLARLQQRTSPRGSFTDSFCDQIVVSAVTMALMLRLPGISIPAGATFLVLYTGVLAISMVRNTLQIPYSWLLRPRLLVYAAIPIQLALDWNLLEPLIWLSNAVLGWKLLTGFWKLRRKLAGPED